MSDTQKTLELVIQELQSRIGVITSNYETQIAILKAQANVEIEKLQEQLKDATEEK